jgi:hypothetical protein
MDNEKPAKEQPRSREALDCMQRREQQERQGQADEATLEIETLDREKGKSL